MALPWWLATTACALLGAVDLVFLAACLVLLARGLRRGGSTAAAAAPAEREALLRKPDHPSPRAFRYVVALGASAVIAAASVVLLALAVLLLPSTPWRAAEAAFLAVHAVAHGAAAWTVAASRTDAHPAHLRVFWLATALGALLFSASAVVRGTDGTLLFPDDAVAVAGLLVSLPLAYAAVTGFTRRGAVASARETWNQSMAARRRPRRRT